MLNLYLKFVTNLDLYFQGGPPTAQFPGSGLPGSAIGNPPALGTASALPPPSNIQSSGLGAFGSGAFGSGGMVSTGMGSAGVGSSGLGPGGLASSGLGTAGLGPGGLGTAGLGSNGMGPVGLGSNGLGSNMGSLCNGGGASSIPSTPQIGSSIMHHNTSGSNPGGGGPLSPGTPGNYDLFANNLYRTSGPPPDNKFNIDMLRDVESSEQVADLIKHLNL